MSYGRVLKTRPQNRFFVVQPPSGVSSYQSATTGGQNGISGHQTAYIGGQNDDFNYQAFNTGRLSDVFDPPAPIIKTTTPMTRSLARRRNSENDKPLILIAEMAILATRPLSPVTKARGVSKCW